LLTVAIVLLARKRGWLRNIVLVALAFSLVDELLMACNLASDEVYNSIFCPLSNTFHFWTIPLLGYVYIREQSVERKRAEEELIALNAIATTIGQSLDLDHMLNAILAKVLEVMDVDAGWIQLLDEDERTLSLAAQRGFAAEIARGIQTIQLDGDLTGQVAQSGQPIVVERIQGDAGFGMWTDHQEEEYAFVGVPIESKDKVVGVLSVFVRAPSKPTVHAVQLLTSIGHQIGIAVENARLAEEAATVEILQELNRLRSELIANVSHEVRTPLGLIKLSCTSLLDENLEFDRDSMRQFLCGIEEETVRLEKTVDNLLDISRIESGRLRLDRRPTDLAQLAVEVIESVAIQSPQHQIVYEFVTPLVAAVDAKRIEQVLRNLLSNAVKYSPEGGVISVQGYEDKDRIVIQVSDQGIGIAPEELDLVFERFYRVRSEVTQYVGGVGLGLAICQNIIEAHGGHIWVESDLGMGSTFYFALPAGTGLVTSSDDSFGVPMSTSRPSQIPV
jgi:K+-sensing histidine kinase KdpD